MFVTQQTFQSEDLKLWQYLSSNQVQDKCFFFFSIKMSDLLQRTLRMVKKQVSASHFVKHENHLGSLFLCITPVAISVGVEWGPEICIFNKPYPQLQNPIVTLMQGVHRVQRCRWKRISGHFGDTYILVLINYLQLTEYTSRCTPSAIKNFLINLNLCCSDLVS